MYQIKNNLSQKVKENIIKQKLQKNKKNLQHVDKVHQKASQQMKSEIRKGIQKRKQFYSEVLSKSPKFNSKTETQQNFKKNKNFMITNPTLNHSRTSQIMERNNLSVQIQMKKIQQRLSKAKNNNLTYRKELLNRLQEKQRHNSMIHQKIRSHSMIQQQKTIKQVYGKNKQIIQAQQKIKDITQKHLSNRRKSFQDKLKKLHQNIKFIESEKIQKYQELQNKFSKIYQENTKYRNINHSVDTHRQRVAMNNIKIQQQKKQKAEQILKKHSQITAKNKIYKEKKDQIFQAIKKINPQIQE